MDLALIIPTNFSGCGSEPASLAFSVRITSPKARYESGIQTRYKGIAERDVSHHNRSMIISWKHKGLRVFFETGSTKGINADHAKRLRRVLLLLNRAKHREELELPGWRFHRLKGDLIDYWSVSISGNWRIIFRMFNGKVELVDYLDYH